MYIVYVFYLRMTLGILALMNIHVISSLGYHSADLFVTKFVGKRASNASCRLVVSMYLLYVCVDRFCIISFRSIYFDVHATSWFDHRLYVSLLDDD